MGRAVCLGLSPSRDFGPQAFLVPSGGRGGLGRLVGASVTSGNVGGGAPPRGGAGGKVGVAGAGFVGNSAAADSLLAPAAFCSGGSGSLGAPSSESKSRYFGSTRSSGIVTAGGGLGSAPFSGFLLIEFVVQLLARARV